MLKNTVSALDGLPTPFNLYRQMPLTRREVTFLTEDIDMERELLLLSPRLKKLRRGEKQIMIDTHEPERNWLTFKLPNFTLQYDSAGERIVDQIAHAAWSEIRKGKFSAIKFFCAPVLNAKYSRQEFDGTYYSGSSGYVRLKFYSEPALAPGTWQPPRSLTVSGRFFVPARRQKERLAIHIGLAILGLESSIFHNRNMRESVGKEETGVAELKAKYKAILAELK